MNHKRDKILRETLTQAHKDYDKGLTHRVTKKISDAVLGKDLVQTTFLKTWVYLVKGGKIDIMKAFLYNILNNLIIDEYRKTKKEVSLDDLITKGFEPEGENSEDIVNKLDGKMVFTLIKQLPEKYQKIITMKYVDEMTLEEISTITKQSKNTVAVQVSRGLEKLGVLYNSKHDK